ncbi:radical SAM protein [Candidatus Dependentiae bacterium]|nr:radical SAM protein [Candidatus Dependentiae bacterium]
MFRLIKHIYRRVNEKLRRKYLIPKSTRLPRVVVWENTNRCNLECKICYRFGKKIDFVEFDNDYFEEKLIPIINKIEQLELSVSGEPFLYSGWNRLKEVFSDSKTRISSYTNGTTLTDNNVEFISEHFSEIHISLDGFSENIYNSIRAGAEFKKIYENILKLIKKTKEKRSKLKIVIDFVIMHSNYTEFLEILKDLGSKGIQYFEASHLVIFNDDLNYESMFKHKEEYNEWHNKVKQLSTKMHLKVLLPGLFVIDEAVSVAKNEVASGTKVRETDKIEPTKPKFRSCPYLWYKTWIDIKGDILSCCHPVPIRMGNLALDSLENIWNGETYNRLRKLFKTGEVPWQCKNCNLIDHQFNEFKGMDYLNQEIKQRSMFQPKGLDEKLSKFYDIKISDDSIFINYKKGNSESIDIFFLLVLYDASGINELKKFAYSQIPLRLKTGNNILKIKGSFPNLKFFLDKNRIYPVTSWNNSKKLPEKIFTGVELKNILFPDLYYKKEIVKENISELFRKIGYVNVK